MDSETHQQDSGNGEIYAAWWSYYNAISEKEDEIAKWELANAKGIPSEIKTREDSLIRLRVELDELKRKVPIGNPLPSGTVRLRLGVPAAEIIDKFRLESPWVEKLKHVKRNPFLEKSGALTQQGCRKSATSGGMPNLFNPVKFAEMLMAREGKTQQQMRRVIESRFKPWLDEWESSQSIDAPNEWDE